VRKSAPHQVAEPVDEPANSGQIQELAQRLAEAEAALQAATAGQVDAVVDPTSGLPILLHEAQAELRRAYDELEELVRERTTELERTNRLLLALIDTMPVGAFISDADGDLLQTNAAGRAILATTVRGTVDSPERPYTTHYPDGNPLPPEDMPLMHALREGRVVRDFEMLIRQPDGEERTLLAGAAPVLDEAGKIVSGIAVFQDITERKIAEDKLAFQTKILNQIAEAVIAIDPEERVTYLNQMAVEQYELDEVEALGRPLTNLHTYEWLEAEDEQAAYASLEAYGRWRGENVHITKTGKRMHVASSVSVLDDEQGPVGGLLAVIRDITAQKQAEAELERLREELQQHAEQLEKMVARRTAALRDSEARFRTVFEDSVLGIALLDPKEQIVACNPALQAILGYHEQELCGTSLAGYSHPDEAEADRELYEALASGEMGYYQIEKRYVRKDGQVRWNELTVSRLKRTKGDERRLAIAMVEDITEKRMNQEALLRAERLAIAGRLGASLAHEINNPLQSVIGCLGLAEEMLDDGAEVRHYLEIAMEELERAADIVTQLRDLSRKPEAKKERVDLNALVEKVLLLTRKRCQNRRVEAAWSPTTELPAVLLAPDRMQQVFLNLVLNAVEAMPEGGLLRVSTGLTTQPDGVCATFADAGVGIEPERLAGIFEPFHSTRPEGLGLGLYISKNIVEEHGGHIDVDSHVGEGTTFTVWLPA
jgi:PAS domain S-box-containing protein